MALHAKSSDSGAWLSEESRKHFPQLSAGNWTEEAGGYEGMEERMSLCFGWK